MPDRISCVNIISGVSNVDSCIKTQSKTLTVGELNIQKGYLFGLFLLYMKYGYRIHLQKPRDNDKVATSFI